MTRAQKKTIFGNRNVDRCVCACVCVNFSKAMLKLKSKYFDFQVSNCRTNVFSTFHLRQSQRIRFIFIFCPFRRIDTCSDAMVPTRECHHALVYEINVRSSILFLDYWLNYNVLLELLLLFGHHSGCQVESSLCQKIVSNSLNRWTISFDSQAKVMSDWSAEISYIILIWSALATIKRNDLPSISQHATAHGCKDGMAFAFTKRNHFATILKSTIHTSENWE